MLHPDATERHEAAGSAEEPFGDEAGLVVEEGESPQPYNLDTLFLWSLLLGIMNQGRPTRNSTGSAACSATTSETADPWLVSRRRRLPTT